jgi:hypothetical protein
MASCRDCRVNKRANHPTPDLAGARVVGSQNFLEENLASVTITGANG